MSLFPNTHTHTHSCQCQSDPDSDTSSPTVTSHTLSCHRAFWQLIHTHTPQGSFAYKGEKAARKTEVGMDYKRSMSQRWVSVCNVMNPREVCGVWSNTWHSRGQVTELANLRSFCTSSKKKGDISHIPRKISSSLWLNKYSCLEWTPVHWYANIIENGFSHTGRKMDGCYPTEQLMKYCSFLFPTH